MHMPRPSRLIKAALRPMINLAVTIVVNTLIGAALFWLFEPDPPGRIGELYWAVTTATTTGYGDISPGTLGGRLTGMWLMISSVIFIAITTAQIAANIIQDPHLFDHEEQEEVKDDLDDALVMLIEICNKLDIPIPESVEEAYTERSTNDTQP